MNRNIESIELYFENIDWIQIPAAYIKKLELLHVKQDPETGKNIELQFMFVLNAAANIDAFGFDEDMHCLDSGEGTLFERLLHPDITQISVQYTDQSSIDYLVIWIDEEGDEYRNQYQSSRILGDGSLLIRICTEV